MMSMEIEAVESSVNDKSTDHDSHLSVMNLDAQAARLYSIAKNWALHNEVNASNIIEFVTTLITAVEQIISEKGQGKKKKQVLLTVLSLVIKYDIKVSEEDRASLLNLMQVIVPTFIDTAISLFTGKIDLFNKIGACCGCIPK
tara:strand:- start:5973 stop:6401 length:429 start_codon:yes stop_codon:yes gene_type:complete